MSGDPAIDATRIALVGFSLGGAVAALAAANDRRVGAIVAVTPPFDPRRGSRGLSRCYGGIWPLSPAARNSSRD